MLGLIDKNLVLDIVISLVQTALKRILLASVILVHKILEKTIVVACGI
jgi:hypothetical protein